MSDLVSDSKANAVMTRLYQEDAEQRRAGLPSNQRTRNVDVETGRFLSLLARAAGAKTVVEIGSSNGLSTLWLALAMRDTEGYVMGTELIEDRVIEANANLDVAGLASHGGVVGGDAKETISGLSGPIDLVFIDAEKDDYIAHFEAVFPLVRPGGLILADNVTSHDLSLYQAMLRARNDVETVTVTLDRGLEMTYKR